MIYAISPGILAEHRPPAMIWAGGLCFEIHLMVCWT